MRVRNTVCLALLAAAGCSTVRVSVPVTRPAEVNLRGKEDLVVGAVTGDDGPAFEGLLKQSIARSGRFNLIDRSNFDAVMREQQLAASSLAAKGKVGVLGKLQTGSVLISGHVSHHHYREDLDQRKLTCKKKDPNDDEKEIEYDCFEYTRRGQVDSEVSFDVVDVATGATLHPDRRTCRRTDETTATDGDPSSIDSVRLLNQCRSEIVAAFMRAIAPWTDHVSVTFETDGDLPQLKTGVALAKNGNWPGAIEQFSAAVEAAKLSPEISPDTRAKAHWNLGLAYEYHGDFAKAEAEIYLAHQITGDDDLLDEISNIQRRRADEAELSNQLGTDGP